MSLFNIDFSKFEPVKVNPSEDYELSLITYHLKCLPNILEIQQEFYSEQFWSIMDKYSNNIIY